MAIRTTATKVSNSFQQEIVSKGHGFKLGKNQATVKFYSRKSDARNDYKLRRRSIKLYKKHLLVYSH